ncbi:hypothetical protein PINS_up022420 [Pythium insidiosum]|uniref:Elicitin n=2 Tax=Pythium insidiosum TaxID=114742 RepID=A0A0E4BYN6_PYTIN|nr:elicitin25 [Pythium insidiosum]BAR64258.1 elicitin25 [Pythium insidiosum]BAR64259.1 elicitin25 [Pythium insidiosum]GLD96135.1 hypothetical protein PINS_up004813 [Pythium insidiosum]GLE10319.1 hypothetical protein PINS_up022420 [Pythium insidiosum]
MKFATVATIAVACVASLASAYNETKPCELADYFKLAPLATNPNLQPCQTASGWTMLPPSGYPTPAQLEIICKNQQCLALLDAVKATNPSDCVLVFNDVRLNVKKVAETSCKA